MSTPLAAWYAMLVLAPALLLAACGGNGDSATSSQSSPASQAASDRPVTDSVHVDAAIEKNPCELAPAEMVARSEEHTSELQSLMRTSYAVFCLKKKKLY